MKVTRDVRRATADILERFECSIIVIVQASLGEGNMSGTRVNIDWERQSFMFTFTHPLLCVCVYVYITPQHPTQKMDTAHPRKFKFIFNTYRQHTRAGT